MKSLFILSLQHFTLLKTYYRHAIFSIILDTKVLDSEDYNLEHIVFCFYLLAVLHLCLCGCTGLSNIEEPEYYQHWCVIPYHFKEEVRLLPLCINKYEVFKLDLMFPVTYTTQMLTWDATSYDFSLWSAMTFLFLFVTISIASIINQFQNHYGYKVGLEPFSHVYSGVKATYTILNKDYTW